MGKQNNINLNYSVKSMLLFGFICLLSTHLSIYVE